MVVWLTLLLTSYNRGALLMLIPKVQQCFRLTGTRAPEGSQMLTSAFHTNWKALGNMALRSWKQYVHPGLPEA